MFGENQVGLNLAKNVFQAYGDDVSRRSSHQSH